MAVINVAPGEIALGQNHDELRTLLGSCVSIVLWHPERKIGAMTHIVLPSRKKRLSFEQADARFADEAWQSLLRKLASKGIAPQRCICKIFGGAQVFGIASADIGRKNLAAVRQELERHKISISCEHVEGIGYRELRFMTHTGEVWVRHVQKSLPGKLVSTDRKLSRKIPGT